MGIKLAIQRYWTALFGGADSRYVGGFRPGTACCDWRRRVSLLLHIVAFFVMVLL